MTVIVAALFLCAPIASAQEVNQDKVNELLKQRNDLIQQIEKARTGAAAEGKKITQLNKEIDVLTTDIKANELKILDAETRIRQTEVEINKLNDGIREQEAKLRVEEENQNDALRNLYEGTNQDPLSLALGKSVTDRIDEAASIEAVEVQIEILKDQIEKRKEELQTQRKLAQDKKVELNKLKLQREAYKSALNQQKNQKNSLLTNSVDQKKEYDKQLEEARRAYTDTTSKLFQETQAARLKAASGTVRRVGNVTFQRPVPGIITTRFGEPTYVQPFHTGWDLDCVMGEPEYAPTDAMITFAGGDRKYGYGLYIDGAVEGLSGITWRTGHMSGFAVNVGDKVKMGDLIGFCGNTGFAYAFHPGGDGTHVHWEIRELNVPVDPAIYSN